MDGVTILSVLDPIRGSELFTVMLLSGIFGGFFMGFMFTLIEGEPCNLITGIIVGLITGLFFGTILSGIQDTSPRYKVTVSEEVNFQEFHNTYDIVSQEGKIYTVKLK